MATQTCRCFGMGATIGMTGKNVVLPIIGGYRSNPICFIITINLGSCQNKIHGGAPVWHAQLEVGSLLQQLSLGASLQNRVQMGVK